MADTQISQGASVPAGVTLGDPTPAGVTLGDPTPPGVTLGDPAQPSLASQDWQELKTEAGQFARGIDTSAAQVPDTADQLIRKHLPRVAAALDQAGAVVNDTLGKIGMHNYIPTAAQTHATATQPVEGTAGYTGAALETMAEWMAGEGEMKALTGSERMMKIAQNMKLLEKMPQLADAIAAHPHVAAMLSAAARQGTIGAAQTAAHGGSASDIATSAATAGVTGGVLEGTMSRLGSVAPRVRTIGGEDIPILASQDADAPKAAKIADISSQPKYQAAQQAGARNVIKNSAQDATRAALTDLNAGRTIPERPALPAPADAQPYKFTLRTAGDVMPTGEGQIALEPGKQQIGTRAVEGKGPGTFDLPQYSPELADAAAERAAQEGTLGATVQPEPVGSHREPVWQYRNAPKPGTEGNVVTDTPMGGRGTVTTTDPALVRRNLTNLEHVMDLDSFNDLSPQRQSDIQDEAKSLRDQLDTYGANKAAMPHFAPIDVEGAAQGVQNYGQAGDQIIEAAEPIVKKMDEVSQNEYSAIRSQQKAALKVIKNPGTDTAYDSAVQRLKDTTGQINDIITRNADQISPGELAQWRAAYHQGMTLNELHAEIEKSFRGPPEDVSARYPNELTTRLQGGEQLNRGIKRVMQSRGNTVTRLIGQNGVDNLYRVSGLLDHGESADDTKSLLGNIGMVARRHMRGLAGLTATAGIGSVAHLLGVPHAVGIATAATAAEGANLWALHSVATNPEAAQRVAYAVKNKISSRIAAPLITSMLLQGQKNQPQEPQ
jgi:hypothetical protein